MGLGQVAMQYLVLVDDPPPDAMLADGFEPGDELVRVTSSTACCRAALSDLLEKELGAPGFHATHTLLR